ncbi:hypothetical protein [Phreatobacter aquaticus]|nr:hypothetical protein [Phreatobacter aquaticus]
MYESQKLSHHLTARDGSAGEDKATLGDLGATSGAYRTMQERL